MAGDIELDTSSPALLVARPGPKAMRYGGLVDWGRTVRAYLLGRGLGSSIVVGFDRDRVLACARAGLGPLRVFGSVEDEVAATAALDVRVLPAAAWRGTDRKPGPIRTVGALAHSTAPGLASARGYARSLLTGEAQLGLPALPKSA